MTQTSSLVGIEFLSWIRDRMQEEVERREARAARESALRGMARMRSGLMTGLALIASFSSSIL